MKTLLNSGVIMSRFVASLTLGLSAVVVGVNLPAASANTSHQFYGGSAPISVEFDGIGSVETIKILLMNGSRQSIEGKLYAYQQAHRALIDRVKVQNEALAKYTRLNEMTYVEAILAFPSGDYKFALDGAARAYNVFQERAEVAFATSELALLDLSDGERLSDAAMIELHGALGL
ncbi:MAG: hypothetical protein ACI9C3_000391 [Yoonia sp.]|jgi:hypothetical protein